MNPLNYNADNRQYKLNCYHFLNLKYFTTKPNSQENWACVDVVPDEVPNS